LVKHSRSLDGSTAAARLFRKDELQIAEAQRSSLNARQFVLADGRNEIEDVEIAMSAQTISSMATSPRNCCAPIELDIR
jgi:hypothetical protein